jgi:hypothetical protein
MNDIVFNHLPNPWFVQTNESWGRLYFTSADDVTLSWYEYGRHAVAGYSAFTVTLPTLNLLDRQTALQLIECMASLPENWDGYGGASIPAEISNIASGLIAALPVHVPTPEVSANANGTISLEWENDAGRAHLEIGKTRYSLYFRRPEGAPVYRDGSINELSSSKRKILTAMYPVAPTPDYTINSIRLAATT